VPLEEGAASVLRTSAGLKVGEKVLIVADPERMGVGRAFFYAAAALGCDPVLSLIRTREAPGREPPDLLSAAMLDADVVLLATVHSMTHTHARRAANRAGARGRKKRRGVEDPARVVVVIAWDRIEAHRRHRGTPPDLFAESRGAVVEGTWSRDGYFQATTILAKHSEEYKAPHDASQGYKELLKTLRGGEGKP